MKKIVLFTLMIFAATFPLLSIDWPQDDVASDSFYSYFGQLRGETISTSLIFALPSEIKSADNGTLLAVIGDYADDSAFFPSTLGSAIILQHEGNLLTVYGNIDEQTLPKSIYSTNEIKKGTVFGSSGNSAWHEGHSSLEFQVIDPKNGTALNPRVILPRVGNELPLTLSSITLESRNGTRHNLNLERNLPAGIYRVYRDRQTVAVPYKTRVTINGTTSDETSYDVINQNENEVYISAHNQYSISTIYPNSNMHFLGQVSLTPGRNILGIVLTNILGEVTQSSWNITAY